MPKLAGLAVILAGLPTAIGFPGSGYGEKIFTAEPIILAQANQKEQKKLDDIERRFPVQSPTSRRHAENIGRIIWSNRAIKFNRQDQATLKTRFNTSDAIYGRTYFPNSLANTALYAVHSSGPLTNQRLGFTFRLRIDGKEIKGPGGAFFAGNLRSDAGLKWTTWQFNPFPKGNPKGLGRLGLAWLRAVKALADGRHRVRFDVWGVMADYRSKTPLASGAFTLVVGGQGLGSGRAVAPATGQLPMDRYGESDIGQIKSQVLRALLGYVFLDPDEIAKISVTRNWSHGVYRDSKKTYRHLTAAVLARDRDKDKICTYDSYLFVSDALAKKKWSPLRLQATCLDCATGETTCRN